MVFLQAAINPWRRYATISAIEDRRVTLCISAELMVEVREVLLRPALAARYSALTQQRVSEFLDRLRLTANAFESVPNAFNWARHPDDDHLFNLAIHAKVRYLVTWEKRILSLLGSATSESEMLRQLAPDLSIITPKELAQTFVLPRSLQGPE
jgi:putative PIN family toxin of toxin-antitoxin system